MTQLSIIVPTFNERDNIEELVRRVEGALVGIDWEMIFVDDDSPDGTACAVAELAGRNPNVRLLLRIGRRGLNSACIEGMLSSSAAVVAVIDADLQHDERLLEPMFDTLKRDAAIDVVVASRHVEGGSIGSWNASRAALSRLATRMSRAMLRADLKDPMSGFFMIRRSSALRCIRAGVSGVGFKILLDLFASSPQPLRFIELPYVFRDRLHGTSKLDSSTAWQYLLMLLQHRLGGLVPARFISFALIGSGGLLVHLLSLTLLFKGLHLPFYRAQGLATLIAMASNYLMNNWLTYADMRLRGLKLVKGWVSFSVICSVGALANVALSDWLFVREPHYWFGWAVVGVAVGSVWNYAVTAIGTWRVPRAT